MLELRPNCECCDRDLPPDSTAALICSFECTFCRDCATTTLLGCCPNCGCELVARPRRPASKLAANPASTRRVLKAGGCAAGILQARAPRLRPGVAFERPGLFARQRVRDALVAVDARLAIRRRVLVRHARELLLPAGIHRLERMAVAALARVARLHVVPDAGRER